MKKEKNSKTESTLNQWKWNIFLNAISLAMLLELVHNIEYIFLYYS